MPAALVRELAYTFGLLPRPEPAADTDAAADGDPADGSHPGHAQDVDGAPPTATSDGAPPTSPTATPRRSRRRSADGLRDDRAREARIAALRAAELAAAEELRAAYAAADRPPARRRGGSATRAALTRLLDTRRLIDTALAERPRIAVVDQLTGTLLALTDSTELRAAAAAGHGLGPPPATAAYQPTDPLYRFVRLRDRRCRFPGCRTRARCCDLDHQVPHPHGPDRARQPRLPVRAPPPALPPGAGLAAAPRPRRQPGLDPAQRPHASPRARPHSAPTTAAPRRRRRRAPAGSGTPTRSPRSGTADRPRRDPTSRSEAAAATEPLPPTSELGGDQGLQGQLGVVLLEAPAGPTCR